MMLTLIGDDGTLLDSIEIEREDWVEAQATAQAALALLNELAAGDDAL